MVLLTPRAAPSGGPRQGLGAGLAQLQKTLVAAALASVLSTAGTPAALADVVNFELKVSSGARIAQRPDPCGALQPLLAVFDRAWSLPPSQVQNYAEVTCPEALSQGRAGGALGAGAGGAGIAQKCVEVKATTLNKTGKEIFDAGVFGTVNNKVDGMSVLGNGQDGKNDSGQFAMIDKIPQGESTVEFIFVAQQGTDCVNTRTKKCSVQGEAPLVPLKFEKVKAISYPGGDRFKAYDECEQNEFAEGC